jgi:propanediol dehydratase small subunit
LTAGQFDMKNLVSLNCHALDNGRQVRRLTHVDPNDSTKVIVIVNASGSESALVLATALDAVSACSGAIDDNFIAGGAIGGVKGATVWDLENESSIPEIDIKVDSISVTAQTKKLKAKWSPELGQDLNAYHNLDAEVELTSVLSEQIALEIDREILEDLVKGAATKLYWSRKPGKFVNRETGADITTTNFPDFTGTVSEWYETLIETVNDVSAQIHRKTIRGGANFMVCGPEVAALLEMTAGFRASIAVDSDGQAGAQKVGSISKKWDVHVDPYFPRNVILFGRKGGSFLESGYVYAPYVPLQVTPTIFGTEDFVPRKGVMTRYGKEMVRADMYGLVVVADLIG